MTTHPTLNGTLAIRRGKITRPQKVVIYGPEGVGKSTLAGQTPDPVFLDIEGGTHHLDVDRFDAAATWDGITSAVAQLAKSDHPFRTLVLDTADWLEKRLAEHLCRKGNKESIEEFGYGKGWVILAEEFARFLGSLDSLLARGMNVVFLAHATVKKFESPDQAGSYDRFELKLSKQVPRCSRNGPMRSCSPPTSPKSSKKTAASSAASAARSGSSSPTTRRRSMPKTATGCPTSCRSRLRRWHRCSVLANPLPRRPSPPPLPSRP